MTTITVQDNKIVMHDDGGLLKVGTEIECCCGCSCPACNPNVELQVNGEDGTYSSCLSGVYQGYTDDLDADNTHGGTGAIMTCEPSPESPNGIIYRVTAQATFANFIFGHPDFGLDCTKIYEGLVEAGADCLPVEGSVALTLIETIDNGGCGKVTEPNVVVNRLDLP